MFPHSFAPFFHLHENMGPSNASAEGKTPAPASVPDPAGDKPAICLDVEKAARLMHAADSTNNDATRQKCRLDIINTVPSESIDWETVDWVELCRFQTTRV